MKTKLLPDLIPRTSFFKNLRSLLKPGEWDTVRRAVYSRAGYKCDICGATGRMECHEKWDYDTDKGIQRLVGLECLCSNCHEVRHIGLAEIRGRLGCARLHMMKVNDMTFTEANKAIVVAFGKWTERNETKWKLDVSKLTEL